MDRCMDDWAFWDTEVIPEKKLFMYFFSNKGVFHSTVDISVSVMCPIQIMSNQKLIGSL